MINFDYVNDLPPVDLENLDSEAIVAKLKGLTEEQRNALAADIEEQRKIAERNNQIVQAGLSMALSMIKAVT